jgi:hypothetical protein
MSVRLISRAALVGGLAALSVPVAASASAPGSVTVTLTKPVARTVTHAAPVACGVDGTTYHAVVKRAVRNYRIAVSDVVTGYTGPGTYQSTARVTVVYVPSGIVRTAYRHVGVDITGSAGESATVPFSVTFSGARRPRLAGRTVAGSISWECAS